AVVIFLTSGEIAACVGVDVCADLVQGAEILSVAAALQGIAGFAGGIIVPLERDGSGRSDGGHQIRGWGGGDRKESAFLQPLKERSFWCGLASILAFTTDQP